MIKSKMDPLVVIEVKNALAVGGYFELTHSELMIDTMHTATTVPEITPEEGQHILENTEKDLEDTQDDQEENISYSQEIERDFASIADPNLKSDKDQEEPIVSSSKLFDWGTSQEDSQQLEEDVQLSQVGTELNTAGPVTSESAHASHREDAAAIRQSERLRNQTSYGLKIVEKASHLQKKKSRR